MAGSVKPLPGGKTRPAPLEAGDLIAVVAPAGPIHEAALAGGLRVLESQGFRVALGEHLRDQRGYLAGQDEARAEDLNRAMADPDIRGILCARGGYGCGRILNRLDYAALRNDPKIFVGYSDVTALHLAFAREVGLVTFHGPTVESLGARLTRLTLETFIRAVTSREPLDVMRMPTDYPAPRVVSAGRATGILAGGNLSLICALMGTRYELETKGKVLVLEDVGEQPYRVDRMLCQLGLAGKLTQAVGVVVGEMVNCADALDLDETEMAAPPEARGPGSLPRRPGPAAVAAAPGSPESTLALDDVVVDYLGGLGRPVISGLPCGHGRDKWTLPLGVMATVDGYKARLIIEEAACV